MKWGPIERVNIVEFVESNTTDSGADEQNTDKLELEGLAQSCDAEKKINKPSSAKDPEYLLEHSASVITECWQKAHTKENKRIQKCSCSFEDFLPS